jgi:polysaccharide chain length determinant protein (PEP-CTERM system associated)
MADITAQPAASLGDYVGALRRRYLYLIIIAPAVLCVCLLAAFVITPLYQSTATILLEPSSVPKDIIESTVISYSDQQIEIVQGRVMTVASLKRIVGEIDPYPKQKELSAGEKAKQVLDNTSVERVDPVTLKPQTESNAFSLHYNNPDPEIAAAVASRLAQLFLSYNQLRRTEAAGEAAGFLHKQADDIVKQMREVDVQLAALKSKYGEALPELLARNQSTIDDRQRQLDALQQQILTAQEKEAELSLQLSQTSPNLITQSGDLTDVATVRAKLSEAEQRYTPEHPEVKRLKKALETLMAQSGGTAQNKLNANNPQYLMIDTELKGTRNSLASMRAQAAAISAKLERSRGFVQETPAAEREFAEVLRRKEVLQNEYQHTQDRLQSANLAETFESQQGGERFSMVREPSVPSSPVFPNRLGLILLGLVLGGTVSVIAVAIAESTDPSVRTPRDIQLPAGVPILASIPFIDNINDRRRRALAVTSFVAAYSIAIVAVGAVIVFSRHR